MAHMESKVVTRYEVWCDECDYVAESGDKQQASDWRTGHEIYHKRKRARLTESH